MNCTTIRVVRRASITVNKGSRVNTIERIPTNNRDVCGNCFVLWIRPKTEKKLPSRAAAYGMREYPSIKAKQQANAVQSTITVKQLAIFGPYNRSMNIE